MSAALVSLTALALLHLDQLPGQLPGQLPTSSPLEAEQRFQNSAKKDDDQLTKKVPIPLVIYIMTSTRNRPEQVSSAAAAPVVAQASTGGRPANSKNFSSSELLFLLNSIKRHLPIGTEEWERVHMEHLEKARADKQWPERTEESLRRKWCTLYRKKKPTGSSARPWEVAMAHEIWEDVQIKSCTSNVEKEEFDITSGFGDSNEVNRYKEPPAPPRDEPPMPTTLPPAPPVLPKKLPKKSAAMSTSCATTKTSNITTSTNAEKRAYIRSNSSGPFAEIADMYKLELQRQANKEKERLEEEKRERKERRRDRREMQEFMMGMMMMMNGSTGDQRPKKKSKFGEPRTIDFGKYRRKYSIGSAIDIASSSDSDSAESSIDLTPALSGRKSEKK